MNKPQSINELSNFAMPTPMPVLAQIVGFTDDDAPLLNLGGQVRPGKMISRLAQLPRDELVDRQAVVLFDHNEQELPVAIDLVHEPGLPPEAAEPDSAANSTEVSVTGETVLIKAEQRVEIRVGKASIVIDENDKITTRSKTQLNRASGPIRIKGGHVDIN